MLLSTFFFQNINHFFDILLFQCPGVLILSALQLQDVAFFLKLIKTIFFPLGLERQLLRPRYHAGPKGQVGK